MANPYIQNLISSKQQGYTAPVAQNDALQTKKAPVQNKSNVRPDNPKGYIVNENIVQSAASSVTGLAKTGVYFVNAMNGKGTDYTVGRINDGARFLGSLGIAGALASTAKSPKLKAMEFVGFTTWFASMSLWPKILGTGIKATKGVDINQEYVDSYGRRKRFFEDAQYLTWDLYKDKDLYKMGDKLGVPRNIENRKDAIKEKAKQVSIQGNTLMMLTAGFATPIGTALICNALEEPVSKAIENYQLRKTQTGLLRNAEKGLEILKAPGLMPGSEKGLEKLGHILGKEATVELNPEKSKQLIDLFSQFSGTVRHGAEKELEKHLTSEVSLGQSAKDGLRKAFMLGDDVIRSLAGDSEEAFNGIKKALTIEPEVFEKSVIKGKTSLKDGVSDVSGAVTRLISRQLNANNLEDFAHEETLIGKVLENLSTEAEKHRTTSVPTGTVKELYKAAFDFTERRTVADKYAGATIANVADSQTANHWAKAPREIIKALGIDAKTRKLIADDPFKAPEYLLEHLENLAKDGEKFEKATKEITKISEDVVARERKAAAKLIRAWRKIGRTSNEATSEFPALKDTLKGTVKLEINNVRNKVMNTESSFYRPLLVLERIKDQKASKDIIKELISGFGIDFWSNKGEHRGIKTTERFEQFVEDAFAPIEKEAGKSKGLRTRISRFYKKIKMPLIHIDGSNNHFYNKEVTKLYNDLYHNDEGPCWFKNLNQAKAEKNQYRIDEALKAIGEIKGKLRATFKIRHNSLTRNTFAEVVTKNPSDWAERVGKSLNDFVRDAAQEQTIKSTWLKKVLFVAVPVAAISLLAISQFGKKNKYNPDVYEVKGHK